MAQLANVSLMFTAHHCGIHTHATQLRNRYHAIPPWPASRHIATDKQRIFPLVFSHDPLLSLSPARLLSRMHAMGGEGIISSSSL